MVRRNQDEFNARDKYPVKVTGVVFSNPIISSLSIAEAGVFLVMADYFIQHALQHMQEADLVDMLTLHSISEEAALKELKHLKIRGLVEQSSAGRFSIPSVSKAFDFAVQEANRRKSGWEKRRSIEMAQASTDSTDEGSAASDSNTTVDALDKLPDDKKKPKAKKAATKAADTNTSEVLVSAGPEDDTEVIARLICDDGKIAKVTRGYALSTEKLYPNVDPIRQLALMEAWCTNNPTKRKTSRRIRTFIGNWLQNALNNIHARNAVIAATRPKAQFGSGGSYDTSEGEAASEVAVSDGLDDFTV